MRRIYASEYWPGREDEAVDDVFFSETPRLPNGLCDQFFVSDIPRLRWLIAFRAARLATRDRMWRDMSEVAPKRITSAVGHALGRGVPFGGVTDAQFDRYVRAAYIAIGEYHWTRSVYAPALDAAGYDALPSRPPLPPLGMALVRPRSAICATVAQIPMLMAAE